MLIVFKIVVEKFNLTAFVYDKLPWIKDFISPAILTLILTVLVGILIIAIVFSTLINLCKVTLNFTIFIKWAGIVVLIIGFIYNLI